MVPDFVVERGSECSEGGRSGRDRTTRVGEHCTAGREVSSGRMTPLLGTEDGREHGQHTGAEAGDESTKERDAERCDAASASGGQVRRQRFDAHFVSASASRYPRICVSSIAPVGITAFGHRADGDQHRR